MDALRNIYMKQFLDILEPSNNTASGNKIKKWYVNYCNKVLNVYDNKWMFNNRQQFIGILRDEYGACEKINETNSRSLGWTLKVNDEYHNIVTSLL